MSGIFTHHYCWKSGELCMGTQELESSRRVCTYSNVSNWSLCIYRASSPEGPTFSSMSISTCSVGAKNTCLCFYKEKVFYCCWHVIFNAAAVVLLFFALLGFAVVEWLKSRSQGSSYFVHRGMSSALLKRRTSLSNRSLFQWYAKYMLEQGVHLRYSNGSHFFCNGIVSMLEFHLMPTWYIKCVLTHTYFVCSLIFPVAFSASASFE